MRGFRGSAARRIGSLLVALLILLPVFASGHHHCADLSRAPDACPVCMVTSNSPAVTAPPVLLLAPVLQGFAPAPPVLAAPGFAAWPLRAARGPPPHTTIRRA